MMNIPPNCCRVVMAASVLSAESLGVTVLDSEDEGEGKADVVVGSAEDSEVDEAVGDGVSVLSAVEEDSVD